MTVPEGVTPDEWIRAMALRASAESTPRSDMNSFTVGAIKRAKIFEEYIRRGMA